MGRFFGWLGAWWDARAERAFQRRLDRNTRALAKRLTREGHPFPQLEAYRARKALEIENARRGHG